MPREEDAVGRGGTQRREGISSGEEEPGWGEEDWWGGTMPGDEDVMGKCGTLNAR